ncbi:TolC family protein [Cardinium endosymbiont of Culicoides punctatus]|uniref:TolC family protein n=1 Tax=Cardinium endosymbiont of Culicoides punctatus TaxID=2304601 RepID=UPI0010CE8CB8|nr:TolC family protein [Cardinium endosymbiont of Culicoides punctatus]TDG95263.1 hypothetical protein CCPUN_05580 [Cardinium endosymbiont of Culicoides punctatus]
MISKKTTMLLRLGILCGMGIVIPGIVYAEKLPQKALTLQEVIEIALKNNVTIQNAQKGKKAYILSNKMKDFTEWFPKARLSFKHDNTWKAKDATFFFQSKPIFSLTWDGKDFFNKIYRAKKRRRENSIQSLEAVKQVSSELQKIVTCYYALALAQKKWGLSNHSIRFAQSTLKDVQEKFKLGMVSKIELLDADLKLKEAKLKILEQQEKLKQQCRNLNLALNKSLDEKILVESDIPIKPIWDIEAITKEKVINLKTSIQEKKVKLAAAELSNTKIRPFTCIEITGNISSQGKTYDIQKRKLLQSAVPEQSLKWGISFDIGSLLFLPAEIKHAKIKLGQEKSKLMQEKLAAEGELETKHWTYHNTIDQHKIQVEKLKVSKQKFLLVKEKYRLNQVKLLDLQRAEQDMQKAEIALIEQAIKVKEAEFALYQLIGMFHI